jgi:hypothetical protein
VIFDDPAVNESMHTLGEMAKALNRTAVELHGLQTRFDLPIIEGAAYPAAYLAFLRTIVFLRLLGVREETLRELWHLEKKLLQLLHADSTGSPTWFLDACGQTTNPRRRLLLSNHDMGIPLPSGALQLGLNFGKELPELFAGKEMGEDALRILGECEKLNQQIRNDVKAELPMLRGAVRWSARLG